jgi:hypothetical protein
MSTMDTDACPSGGSVCSTSAGFGSQSKLRANNGRCGSPDATKSEHPNGDVDGGAFTPASAS